MLGNAFDVPGLTVDTHFGRLVRRWEWTDETDPVKVEQVVAGLIPKKEWTMLLAPGDLARPARVPRAQAGMRCLRDRARCARRSGQGPTDPEAAAKLVKSEKQMSET